MSGCFVEVSQGFWGALSALCGVIVDSIAGCLGGTLFGRLGLVLVNLEGVRMRDEQGSCLLRMLLGPQ